MKIFGLTLVSAAVVFCSACASGKFNDIEPDPEFLKIAISPEDFDGEMVTIRGWMSLRFEDRNLWATRKDHEDWETRRCISLVNYSALKEVQGALDGRYVEVSGILRSDATMSGTLIRLASCRKVGIEISGASSVRLLFE